MAKLDCIHRRNPSGGFASQHRRFCAVFDCAEDAVCHVYLGMWCANLCAKHAERYRKGYRAEIVNKVVYTQEGE